MKPNLTSSNKSRSISHRLLISAALCTCSLLWAGTQHALAEAETRAVISESGNTYQAGCPVRSPGPVEGDLFAAGCSVNVEHPVKGDAALAGGHISVNSAIGDDLRAAGGQVTVNGKIGGEAMLAGGKINVGNNADVQGKLWAAGGNITLAGKYAKGIKAYGRNITVAGEVNGDTRLTAESIEILPGAKINGALTYTSREELKFDPAQVTGAVTRSAAPKDGRGWQEGEQMRERNWGNRHGTSFRPFLLLGLIAAAAVFILLFPNATRGAQQEVGASPWKSLGLGAALLFTLPPIAILLMISIIGIPLAFALLALYPVLLLVGYLTTALYIGDRTATALKKDTTNAIWIRIGFAALALLALWLIRLIPVAGSLAVFVTLLIGVGAWSLHLYHRYKV
ncbi:MAG: polymer-forming cytoskeletal protein [Burkholderiales bacterium]